MRCSGPGLRKSLQLFTVFVVVWTPYRFLTGMLGWKVIPHQPIPVIVESLAKILIIPGLVYLFLRRFGDSWSDVGVSGRGLRKSVFLALLGSLALISVYLALGSPVRPDPLVVGYLFLAVGPTEELMNRGYYFSMIYRDCGSEFWTAAVLSSLIFSLAHLPIDLLVAGYGPAMTFLHLTFAFLAGILLSAYYRMGWNIAGPSLLHAAMDTCNTYFRFSSPQLQFSSLVLGMIVMGLIPVLWSMRGPAHSSSR